MNELITWGQTHWVEIGAVLFGVIAIANIAVGWTETKADDRVVAKIAKIIGKIFGKEIPK